jgi:hypothetical protein
MLPHLPGHEYLARSPSLLTDDSWTTMSSITTSPNMPMQCDELLVYGSDVGRRSRTLSIPTSLSSRYTLPRQSDLDRGPLFDSMSNLPAWSGEGGHDRDQDDPGIMPLLRTVMQVICWLFIMSMLIHIVSSQLESANELTGQYETSERVVATTDDMEYGGLPRVLTRRFHNQSLAPHQSLASPEHLDAYHVSAKMGFSIYPINLSLY